MKPIFRYTLVKWRRLWFESCVDKHTVVEVATFRIYMIIVYHCIFILYFRTHVCTLYATKCICMYMNRQSNIQQRVIPAGSRMSLQRNYIFTQRNMRCTMLYSLKCSIMCINKLYVQPFIFLRIAQYALDHLCCRTFGTEELRSRKNTFAK